MESKVIDADGHVYEDASVADFVEEPFRSRSGLLNFGVTGTHRLWPTPDAHHFGIGYRSPKAFGGGGKVGPAEWLAFLEASGVECSVLYPTAGLSMGLISSPDWAIAISRAYNNWLRERYLAASPRLKGMAMLPLQDVSAAVEELRRAVKELGMVGGLLPSRGLPKNLGAEEYWPVYKEAERLGCALAVHGGSHAGMGLDGFTVYPPIGGLGHPFSLMIALSGFLFHGALDRFPRLRLGFLEGGAGWTSFWMDRMDRSVKYHFVIDPRRRYRGPTLEDPPSSCLASGRIFIGCEGNEQSLAYQVGRVGDQPFLFASDFPHEIGPEDCRREARGIADSKTLSSKAKRAILQGNARRFYGL
ncbi:MAG: amidohydrolase [Elusimicrobia bacterium]|nr:amidohydrolase [Elusimicrobiota bacterium]